MKYTILFICFTAFFSNNQCYGQKSREVDLALDALQQWYHPETGRWNTTNWWNTANIVTSLVRYSELTGSDKYLPVIDNVFERSKKVEKVTNGERRIVTENFINSYYDDQAWWALAWIEAYKLTGDQKYMDMAKIIFADLTTGYDEVCGGGIYWKKPKQYKNAIANGLFMLTAFRLHHLDQSTIVSGKTFLGWAVEIGDWFEKSGMLNESVWLIEDGLNNCVPNRGRNWTYNQGVIIAVLCEAFHVSRNKHWLDIAEKIAQSVIEKKVYDNGILKDETEPDLNQDRTQYKGIFMRHLAFLYKTTQKQDYKDFILKNANSIWNNARNPVNHQFSCVWAGPFDKADASTQSSAIDCLLEAMNLAN